LIGEEIGEEPTTARSRGSGLPRKAGRRTSFMASLFGVGIGIGIAIGAGIESASRNRLEYRCRFWSNHPLERHAGTAQPVGVARSEAVGL